MAFIMTLLVLSINVTGRELQAPVVWGLLFSLLHTLLVEDPHFKIMDHRQQFSLLGLQLLDDQLLKTDSVCRFHKSYSSERSTY